MRYTTLIDADALRELMADAAGAGNTRVSAGAPGSGSSLVILDCRFELTDPAAGRQAYATAHIPGAHFVDLNADLSAPPSATSGRHPLPDPSVLAARFAALGISQGTQVVAYDESNGSFAARAWWLLRWLGHAEAAVLDGGFKSWVAHGGIVSADESTAVAPLAALPPTANHAWVVSAADVAAVLGDSRRLLIDARAPERYAGTVEPIDSVAGHVPGAVNHPFALNLGTDGHFLPALELHRRWAARLAGMAPVDAIVMCGSGVTACHNLLALERAGLSGAKLFAGSWSEWVRDPHRPVARGSEP